MIELCGWIPNDCVFYMAGILILLIVHDALRNWINSFRTDHCKKAHEKSDKILDILRDHKDLKTEILLELKEISVVNSATTKLLDKLLDRCEGKD